MRENVTAPSYRATLTTYLWPYRARLSALFLALLGSIGLQLAVPLLLKRFVDAALAGAVVSSLVAVGIAYLVAGILNQLFSALAAYIGADLGWRATNQLRHDLARHLLGLDMGYHTSTTPGEMIERVDGDVTAVANFIARFVVRLAGSGLLLVGVLVVSFVESWILGVVVGGYIAGVLIVLVRMRSYAVSAAEEEREASAALYGFIEERLAGIEDIRANGGGEYTMFRFVDVMRDFYARTVTAWRRRTVFWISANTAFWTGDALALGAGVWLHQRGTITVGAAYLILQYMQLVRTPIEQVAQEMQELQKAAGGIVRIDAVRSIESGLDESGVVVLPPGPLGVAFEQVSFRYDDRPVLDSVSFRIEPGTVVGLLGRTGGGKTTITRLISRLYDADQGRILLGTTDIRSLSAPALRQAVGVVTQDVQLFAASIRQNLTFFDDSIGDERLMAALDTAGLGEWVRGLGLDTLLGSAGQGLSAGEAQLLAFARVFIQDPRIVILDEPSSRLDPHTESLIADATHRLFRNRTVVMVAHRLESVRVADEIMVVDAGRLVEHGGRDELAADPTSRYARLLAAGTGADLA